MKHEVTTSFIRATRRAIHNPFFLAGVLHEYQQQQQLDDEALAAVLGCALHDLPRLALCRRPSSEAGQFVNDIEHLAQRFHLEANQLAMIIRQVDAIQGLRQQLALAQGTASVLRAARDRDEDDKAEDGNE